MLGLCLCLASRGALGNEASPNPNGILASFVVLGDNQLGEERAAPGDLSSANVAQLRQTLKDIAALNPSPSLLFLTGDLVDHGRAEGGPALQDRLEAWTKLYRRLCREFDLDLPLVPLPGNKELMQIVERDGQPIETFLPNSHSVWLKWLDRSGFDRFAGNGPAAAEPNLDGLAGDNSRLTYSFDDQAGNHYIVINTFTLNNQPEPPRGWIPYHWIAQDARKAEANPKVRHIWAFGHMPIRIKGFPYDTQGVNSILNSDSHPLARQLQATLGGLSKFRGYFCGHLHLWDCSPLPDSQAVWQVITGNSGSKLIQHNAGEWQAPYFFGFTVVRIHSDGQVGVVGYRRPVPEPYYSTAPQPPAQPQPERLLRRDGSFPPALKSDP